MRKRAMKLWKGDLAKISGAPFSGPLRGKRYDHDSELQVVEGANNSTFKGSGKAVVNGKPLKGYYFEATRGSAQGVGWNGGMKVYPVPGVFDLYFAASSRPGLRASVLARRVLHLAKRSPELKGHMAPAIKVARKILKNQRS